LGQSGGWYVSAGGEVDRDLRERVGISGVEGGDELGGRGDIDGERSAGTGAG
jgi:hypothetical protein